MPTYHVNLGTTAWFGVTVEADSEDEAVDKALDQAPGLCAQCSGWGKEWGLELNDTWGDGILDHTGQDVATPGGAGRVSAARRKGTAAESVAVSYLRANGFVHAERRALHGSLDLGDITGTPGICWEVKSCATPSWPAWMRELESERLNSRSELGFLVYKPKGKGAGRVATWQVGMSADTFRAISDPDVGCQFYQAGAADLGPLVADAAGRITTRYPLAVARVRPRGTDLERGDWPAYTYLSWAVAMLRQAGYGSPIEEVSTDDRVPA